PERYPRTRAGRNSTARSNANSASKVMPIKRNGNDKSHTSGQRMSASRASGQQGTNKRHQPTSKRSVFMVASPTHSVGTRTSARSPEVNLQTARPAPSFSWARIRAGAKHGRIGERNYRRREYHSRVHFDRVGTD